MSKLRNVRRKQWVRYLKWMDRLKVRNSKLVFPKAWNSGRWFK